MKYYSICYLFEFLLLFLYLYLKILKLCDVELNLAKAIKHWSIE